MNERTRSVTSQDEVRRNNLSRLLEHLHVSGSATRSELANLTGLNRSTVGALVGELTEMGLVEQGAGAAEGVGRPSISVSVVPEAAIVLAFDLRVERTIGALVGLGGMVLHTIERQHQRRGFDPKFAANDLADLAVELFAHASQNSAWVCTAICLPGMVSNPGGVVRFAPNLEWTDAPFGALVNAAFVERFGTAPRTIVRNDADLGALGECVRGVAVGAKDVLYIAGDVGIGGGVVLDGRLLVGAGGLGGEVGHMKVMSPGKSCRCGESGCWETEIGSEAIVRAAGFDPSTHELSDTIEAAEAGDQRARDAIEEARKWLGIGIGNLANVLNPQCVVLGGHLANLIRSGMAAEDLLLSSALAAPRSQVRIVVTEPGRSGPLIGAAECAFEELLNNPVLGMQRAARVAA